MQAVVLFRADSSLEDELHLASRFFKVIRFRTEAKAGDLVISRYASLPYPEELEEDLHNLGARLLNSAQAHRYIANMDYLEDIAPLTFPTWFNACDIPQNLRDAPFVVKGRTNSYKWQWNKKMWVPNWKEAVKLAAELAGDDFVGRQGLVFRQYVPLETFELGLNGLPFTNEWRVFFCKGQLVSYGYYWGCADAPDLIREAKTQFLSHGLPLAKQAYNAMPPQVAFVAVDVARGADGKWWVVEVNDGCQSGLNGTIDPTDFYSKLFHSLEDTL